MVAATYDVARARAADAAGAAAPAKAAPRKRWFARWMDALIEARMEQARREVARHMHFLPYALDENGNRVVKTRADDMPFGGW
jgi:hypothetical protein